MSKLVFRAIAQVGDEPQEIYWLAGLEAARTRDWYVRLVLLGQKSGRFHVMSAPIGLFPILTLGAWFDRGEFRTTGARGEIATALIQDVSAGEVVTSADIPEQLYRFPGRPGAQRLFRYRAGDSDVFIPAAELVRYLFLHNRTLATAIMRPGALNLLFRPEIPGYQERRLVAFTREMPHQCVTRHFVKEFAWLALEPGARRSWDSVAEQTTDHDHVMFSPPPICDSLWRFRGVRCGQRWLVLELLSLGGRRLPCEELSYSHPRFRNAIRVSVGADAPKPGGERPSPREHVRYVYEIDGGRDGATASRNLRTAGLDARAMDFESPIKLIRLAEHARRRRSVRAGEVTNGGAPGNVRTIVIGVSAGERSDNASSPPLEFRSPSPVTPEAAGDFGALEACMRWLRTQLPHADIATTTVQLKSGRAFSALGRDLRRAMAVTIRLPGHSPAVLLDIDRTGVVALSTMVLLFSDPMVPVGAIETAIRRTFDGLVDAGGHWSREIEEELRGACRSRRLPKFLTPRNQAQEQPERWAARLTAILLE